jgi:hypothetical protein
MIPCTCFSPRPRPSRVRPRHQLLAAAQVSCWAHPWRSRLRADDPSGVAFQLKTTSFTRPATTPAIGRCTSQLFWHTLGDLALKGPPITMIPCTCFSPRPRPSRVRPRHQLLAAAQASCWAHPWRSRLRADDPSGVAFQLKTVTIPSSLERSAHNHDPMHLLQSKTTSFTRPATTPAIGRCTSQLLGTPLAISPSG